MHKESYHPVDKNYLFSKLSNKDTISNAALYYCECIKIVEGWN